MDSMKRGEANISHHPKKVVSNNLVTDSNKISTSSTHANTNNNKATKAQQQENNSTDQIAKQETNFEDYDNEWDVGIGDLIIDLDADIEKSTQQSSNSSGNSTGSLQIAGNVTPNKNNNNNSRNIVKAANNNKDPLAIPKTLASKSVTKLEQVNKNAANIAGKDQKKISGGTSTVSTPATGAATKTSKVNDSSSTSGSGTTNASTKIASNSANATGNTTPSKHHHHSHHSHKSSSSSSSSSGNSTNSSNSSVTNASSSVKSETSSSSASTSEKMSSASGSGTNSKSAGKLSAATTAAVVDHQATLDKGLKMKIKRTKPGTKTSEAKHEIVKAEQNGAASGLDSDTNSSSGGSNNSGNTSKKHTTLPGSGTTQIVVPGTPTTTSSTSVSTTPQSNKRGSSSHRRDKQKDKKDKSDHSGTSCNCSSSASASTDGVNGVVTCSSTACKNRTDSLSMRLSGNLGGGLNSSGSNNFATGLVTPNSGSIKDKISSSVATLSQQSGSSTNTSTSSNNNTNSSSSNTANKNQSNTSTLISTSNNVLGNRENAFNTSSKNLVQSNSLYADDKQSSSSGRSSPPLKRIKCEPTDMVDACVGTSVGTITEPDCLGPCEPGTSVTLEGIVWHETEGGVLVVNVTWRGKTYVGTLLDCTRHDWAPPRLCDSPTEDLDSRTPKGRETRSSVNSKLRNGANNKRGGRTSTTGAATSTTNSSSSSSSNSSSGTSTTNSSNTSTPSPNTGAFLPPRPEKRKSKDESPSPLNGNASGGSNSSAAGQTASGAITQSVVNPVTGQNVQISTKKCKTASPCAVSPVLLECPEQDCSKKYKHANGLRYHQSHAHGSISSMDEDSSHSQLPESPQRLNPPSTPSSPGLDKAMPTNNTINSTTTTPVGQTTNLATPETPTKPPEAANLSAAATTTSPMSVDGPASSVVGGSITTGAPGQPTSSLPTTPSDNKPLESPLRPGDLTLKAKSSILRYHHGEIPSQHTIEAIATSHHAASGNGALNLIERPQMSLQQQQGPPIQQQPLSMMTQHHHSQQHGTLSALSASLNAAPMQMRPISGLLGPTSGQIAANQAHITDLSVQNPALLKGPSGFTKPNSKKNRKSPVPSDFDNSINRDDVQSPAYSDISDDSTPQIVEPEEKSKNIPATSDGGSLSGKKSNEGTSGPGGGGPPLGPLGGYGMYPMYPNMPPYYPPGHPDAGKPIPIPQSPSSLAGSVRDAKDPNNAPPLDLINKPLQQQNSDNNGNLQPLIPGKDSLQTNIPTTPQGPSGGPQGGPPGKLPPHYFPLGYQLSYPFNMDPNYGPVPMMTDAEKMRAMAVAEAVNIKEERNKESSSPNDHPKSGTQQSLQGKIIKSEPLSLKDIKTEVGHSGSPMHPMYQRHSLGPPPHLAREEEIRRYYAQFSPNQRRSSHPGGPPGSMGSKDDSPSGSGSHSSGSGPPTPTGAQSLQSMQQASKNLKSSMLSQSPQQKPSNLSSKDSSDRKSSSSSASMDDKDMPKVKQEGQKPTMETQGPPPPPTSQFYLHPSFASPYPFEPIYRNMLVSAPFNAPAYHLPPMARIPPPEDLSRGPNTKALDLLQHHATQYYNSHKIHELTEHGLVNDRSLKSPTSNVKVSVSSPSLTGPQGSSSQSNNSGDRSIPPSPNHPPGPSPGPPNMQSRESQQQPKNLEKAHNEQNVGGKGNVGEIGPPAGADLKDNNGRSAEGGRSPPPQRHVHTHHHTHVGLGYPMYPAPYGAAAVLASQQAAAVAVINPYPPPPSK